MLVVRPPLITTVEPRETIWVGDDAVDPEASDLEAWARTGDIGSLRLRPGVEPARIKWRPIDHLEISRLPSVQFDNVLSLQDRLQSAARFGLISIEGVKLRRETERMIPAIPLDSIRSLCAMIGIFPAWAAMNAWSMAELGLDIVPREGRQVMDLATWLGCIILADSFRVLG